ncbi:MAG: phosphoadenosine phosphosulfate reductase family protein [Desulfohalobiaceae bacterium]|nr:phosphoadenosine phosphosulfate reductase family protein [Desulfohalobiaceae bacterium]
MTQESLSLPEKTELTRARLQDIAREYDPGFVFVAWTGGKDSTVVLWLWRMVLREVFAESGPAARALRLETGLDFPEIYKFCHDLVRQWGIKEVRAGPIPEDMPIEPGLDPVTCCRLLKIKPLSRAVTEQGVEVLVTGLRRDEHPGRDNRSLREHRQDPRYLQLNPILEWTEIDVWSFILAESLPYCSLYELGYRSLDCRPCTEQSELGERGGRNQDKERQMELLRSLGYF